MTKTIIIAESDHSMQVLRLMLKKYGHSIEIVGTATDIDTGFFLIRQIEPQLVILDIEMKKGNGFELLNRFEQVYFQVLFITGFSRFAIQAIRHSAFDYLLKPINPLELKEAIQRIEQTLKQEKEQMDLSKFNTKQVGQSNQLVLPTKSGYNIIPFDQLIRVEAQGSYTVFHLENGRSFLASHSLCYYEDQLSPAYFFRIHKSYIINCHKIVSFESGRTGRVFLIDGSALNIAARRKGAFLKAVNKLLAG